MSFDSTQTQITFPVWENSMRIIPKLHKWNSAKKFGLIGLKIDSKDKVPKEFPIATTGYKGCTASVLI